MPQGQYHPLTGLHASLARAMRLTWKRGYLHGRTQKRSLNRSNSLQTAAPAARRHPSALPCPCSRSTSIVQARVLMKARSAYWSGQKMNCVRSMANMDRLRKCQRNGICRRNRRRRCESRRYPRSCGRQCNWLKFSPVDHPKHSHAGHAFA